MGGAFASPTDGPLRRFAAAAANRRIARCFHDEAAEWPKATLQLRHARLAAFRRAGGGGSGGWGVGGGGVGGGWGPWGGGGWGFCVVRGSGCYSMVLSALSGLGLLDFS